LNHFLVARDRFFNWMCHEARSCAARCTAAIAGNRNIRDESKRWQIKRDDVTPIIVMVQRRPNILGAYHPASKRNGEARKIETPFHFSASRVPPKAVIGAVGFRGSFADVRAAAATPDGWLHATPIRDRHRCPVPSL
jgi:hypothetical protein